MCVSSWAHAVSSHNQLWERGMRKLKVGSLIKTQNSHIYIVATALGNTMIKPSLGKLSGINSSDLEDLFPSISIQLQSMVVGAG